MKTHTTLKSKYLLWAVYMMMLSLFGACQKADKLDKDGLQCPVVAKEGPDDSVIGKWKFVKVEKVFYNPRTIDYSCSDIEYEFQEGGVLIVTGASEDTRSYKKDGQYSFEFKDTKLYEHAPEKYTLKIENSSISCGIQDNKMVFNDSDFDGDIVHFVRVE